MPRKDDRDEFAGEEFEDFREEFDDDVEEVEAGAADEVEDEPEEKKPAPKKRSRRRRKPKEEPVAKSDEDANADANADDADADAESESAEGDDAAAEDATPPEPEPEPEPEILEPDHPDTIASLNDIGARLELNDRGNAWRLFFYEKHGDRELEQIHGLPSLKELWLLGTQVTKPAADAIGERLPNVKVYYG